jgi:hypothetical protein
MERREYVILVLEAHPQSKQDLALRVHAAVHSLFDAVNGAKRHFGLAGQLRLRHEPILAQFAYSIGTVPGVAHVAFPQPSRGSALWQLPGISDELRISLEKIVVWRIFEELTEDWREAQDSRGDAGLDASSRPLFEPKLHVKDVQLPPATPPSGAGRRGRANCPPMPGGDARRQSCGAR